METSTKPKEYFGRLKENIEDIMEADTMGI